MSSSSSSRHKLIPAVHLLLVDDDKILLLRRCNTGFADGSYSVPAGHVEANESATEALAREVWEEIGVEVASLSLSFSSVMHRKTPDAERVDFFFTARGCPEDVKNGEPDKCDDLAWFPLSDLPQNMVPYVRSTIDHYRHGHTYTEFGWDQRGTSGPRLRPD